MSTCPSCQADNAAGAKFCSNCGTQLRPAGQSQRARKQVTVLFTDVVDSTALGRRLDNEPYGRVLERFFATARQVLERHHGAVQKYVGDAVMAVFGLPQVHEDDTLRAVKAAVELHAEVRTLNAELLRDWGVELRVHTAISTGGVVVEEDDTRELGVAADHINLVASLIKLAEPDMILIDPTTHQHVRGMVKADAVRLPTPGDSGPVYNVLGLSEQPTLPHRMVTPMIGREWELGWLRLAYEGVLRKRASYLVSVLGAPGIGKTRLVEEFSRELSRRTPQERPQVLRGLCVRPIPASTYYPARQILRQAAGIRADASEAEALRQLDEWVEGDQAVVARLAAFLELSGQVAEPEDTIRAICRALAIAARRGPLVLVVDDLHWAEQPMLDAMLRIKESLADVPVLMVAISREVFFDESRGWAGGWARNSSSVTLEPLSETETEQLISQILLGGEPDPKVVQALVRETGGTPLDVEALMANLIEDGVLRLEDGRWTLTEDLSVLRKLLRGGAAFAARVERLDPVERRVIVRAALVGMEFRSAEVVALLPDLDPADVTARLQSLVRRDLLKLNPETLGALEPGDEAYTFTHSNYQEAAYNRLTLEDRMVLHEQYARWLADAGDDSPTTAERIAFHFRQSHDSLVAFRGDAAERVGELAQESGRWYARAGRGYIIEATSPVRSVMRVLDRAIRLLPEGSPEQLQARLDLADTLQEPEPPRARDIYTEVAEAARAIGNRPLQRHADLGRLEVRWYFESEGDYNKDLAWIADAIQEFEALGDVTGWHLAAKAYRLQSLALAAVGQTTHSIEAADRALEAVKRANDTRLHAKILGMKYVNEFWGPTPLEEVVQRIREVTRWARQEGLFSLEALGLNLQGREAAMRGDFQRARQFLQEARQVITRRTDLLTSPADAISEGMVEMLAGNLEDAERQLRAGYETELERDSGHPAVTTGALLARALLLSGRDAAAQEVITSYRPRLFPTQLDNQIKARQLDAILLAHGGDLDAAEALAREAVALSDQSEQPLSKAEAFTDLAEILRQGGNTEEAGILAEQAKRLYRGKGHIVAAHETERLLDRIRPTARA